MSFCTSRSFKRNQSLSRNLMIIEQTGKTLVCHRSVSNGSESAGIFRLLGHRCVWKESTICLKALWQMSCSWKVARRKTAGSCQELGRSCNKPQLCAGNIWYQSFKSGAIEPTIPQGWKFLFCLLLLDFKFVVSTS